ncbi:hypothetical protein POK33_39105 [Burkholderia cenocepacia]|uniref:hypothetical protein n=1 Tax=Burkholderia cenocepacia TaxID=95486 RepID=UPI0023B8DCC2|nr:hypothetical protein [Burkholderia cenocepacia]MDF0506764.1 hypothetical protein [Burkholderia cenocepacia]
MQSLDPLHRLSKRAGAQPYFPIPLNTDTPVEPTTDEQASLKRVKDTSKMTTKLRLVESSASTQRVAERRRQIRQLHEIRKVLQARSLGALAPRPLLAFLASSATLVTITSALYRLGVSSTLSLSIAAITSGIIASTIMRRSSRPRTHAAHLNQLLADYSPTSKDAYRRLQENIRQAGYFDRDYIEMWISEERAAIDRAERSPGPPSRGFLDKQV